MTEERLAELAALCAAPTLEGLTYQWTYQWQVGYIQDYAGRIVAQVSDASAGKFFAEAPDAVRALLAEVTQFRKLLELCEGGDCARPGSVHCEGCGRLLCGHHVYWYRGHQVPMCYQCRHMEEGSE